MARALSELASRPRAVSLRSFPGEAGRQIPTNRQNSVSREWLHSFCGLPHFLTFALSVLLAKILDPCGLLFGRPLAASANDLACSLASFHFLYPVVLQLSFRSADAFIACRGNFSQNLCVSLSGRQTGSNFVPQTAC